MSWIEELVIKAFCW